MPLSEYDQNMLDINNDYLHTLEGMRKKDTEKLEQCKLFLKYWEWIFAFHVLFAVIFAFILYLAVSEKSLTWALIASVLLPLNTYLGHKTFNKDLPKAKVDAFALPQQIENTEREIAITKKQIKELMENNV